MTSHHVPFPGSLAADRKVRGKSWKLRFIYFFPVPWLVTKAAGWQASDTAKHGACDVLHLRLQA